MSADAPSRDRVPSRDRQGAVVVAVLLALLFAGSALAQPMQESNLPAPRLTTVMPPGGKIGSSVEVTLTGTDLEEPEKLLFNHPGIKAEPLEMPAPKTPPAKQPQPRQRRRGRNMGTPGVSRFKVTVSADVPPGIYDIRFVNKWGISNARAFAVGDLGEAAEKEPNNDVEQAQRLALNSTVNGAMVSPVDVDYYVFSGKKGQRVVCSCLASSIDSRFHAGIEIYDKKGRQLASGRDYTDRDALTDCILPEDGDYFVRVFQFTHTEGTAEHFYRLSVSTAPWIDSIFPCVIEAGKATTVTIWGRNLPGGQLDPSAVIDERVLEKITVNVVAPTDAAERLAFDGLLLPRMAGIDGFTYRIRNEAGWSNPFLLTMTRGPVLLDNGANETPETAQAIALPCEIAGHIEKRRDRDWYSFTAKKGEVWNIEIISDRLGAPTFPYFMLRNAKGDLLKESDDNPVFLGPQFFIRSEDPQTYRFTAPADGKYQLLVSSRLADTVADPRQRYRVRIAPPRPDFHLVALEPSEFRPTGATVLSGGEQGFTIYAIRQDGFTGDITLTAKGLPTGVSAEPQTLSGTARQRTHFTVSAAAAAAAWTGEIQIQGTAVINGKKVVRTARAGGIVWPMQPGLPFPTISRIDRGVFLAVRPGAPYSLRGSLDKPVLAQGEKGTIKLKLSRLWPDFKSPLTVQVLPPDLPQGLIVNNNQPSNIAANKNDGTLSVNVNNNVPPGTYTIVLRTQAQIPYNRDPKAKQKPNTLVVLPSAPVKVIVRPRSVARLSLSAGTATIKVGKEGKVTVRVARQYGYDGEFTVQVLLPQDPKGVQIAEAVIPAGKNEAALTVKAGAMPANLPNLIVRATAMYQGSAIAHDVKLNVNVVK